jgi:hypothetical protein
VAHGEEELIHLGTFLLQDEQVGVSTLIYFAIFTYSLHQLSGLANKEEIDVQLKSLPWDMLTGTLSPCLKH